MGIIDAVPRFWLLLAGAIVALLAETYVIVVSAARLKRQRAIEDSGDPRQADGLNIPPRALEIVAGLMPIALAAAFAVAMRSARNLLHHAMTGTIDPSEKAELASKALAGELNTMPMGLLCVGAAAAMGCVAVGMAVSARLRVHGLRHAAAVAARGGQEAATAWLKFPGPIPTVLVLSIAAFIVLGFGPIANGGFESVLAKIKNFASVAGAPVDMKVQLFDQALDDARSLLDARFALARFGVAAATLVVGLLTWLFSPVRARAHMLGAADAQHAPSRTSARALVIAAGTIAVAAAGFVAGRPMRHENQMPWPPPEGGEKLLVTIKTPDLEGPDVMERAPVIHVTPDAMGLDGASTDATELADKLWTLRRNYSLLHPYEDFNGRAIIVCQHDTAVTRVAPLLRAALRAEFPNPVFVFLREQVADRPLIGRLWRNRARAAYASTVEDRDDAATDATVVEVALFSTCADLSKAIVAARNEHRDVALLLP